MDIKFKDLNTQSIEGQLLLTAFYLITGDKTLSTADETIKQLIEIHKGLCFEKNVDIIIEDLNTPEEEK